MCGEVIGQTRRAFLWAAGSTCLLSAISACATDPTIADIERAIRLGRFNQALAMAETLRAGSGDTARLRWMIGATQFALGDFEEARGTFARTGAARIYPIADADADAEDELLRTGIAQRHWLSLTVARLVKSPSGIAMFAPLDPLEGLLAGAWDPERYVQEQVARARQRWDGTILSTASSPGRDAMLDHFASERQPEYRCTGYFVAGEIALARGDLMRARALLKQAVGNEVPLLEFYVAKAELARLA